MASEVFTESAHTEVWLHACKGTTARLADLNCHGGTGSVDLRAFTPDVGATPGDGLFFQGVLQPLYLAQQQTLLNGVGTAGKGFGFWFRCRRAAGSDDETPPGYGTGEDSTTGEDMIDAMIDIWGCPGAILMGAMNLGAGRAWQRLGGPECDLGPGRWDNTVFGPTFASGETDPTGAQECRDKMRTFSNRMGTRFMSEAPHVRLCAPGIQRARILGKSFASLSATLQYAYQTQSRILEDAMLYLSDTEEKRQRHMVDLHYGSAGVNDCFNTANKVRGFLVKNATTKLCLVGSWETGIVSVPRDPTAPTAEEYVEMARQYRLIYDGAGDPRVRSGLFENYGMNMMTLRPNSPESGDFVASSVYSDNGNPGTRRPEIWPIANSICACARHRVGS